MELPAKLQARKETGVNIFKIFRKKPNTDVPVFYKYVQAYSVYSGADEKRAGTWAEYCVVNLFVSKETQTRTFEKIGHWPGSPAAMDVRASVEAWIAGGPDPKTMGAIVESPNPKPRKPLPEKTPRKKQEAKAAGNVLEFRIKGNAA